MNHKKNTIIILNCLTKVQLLELSNACGFKGFWVLTKNDIIKHLASKNSSDLLSTLRLPELQFIAHELGVDVIALKKDQVIDKILDHTGDREIWDGFYENPKNLGLESERVVVDQYKKGTIEKQNWEALIIQSKLSLRTTNVLLNNFSSLEELTGYKRDQLFKLKNCGVKTVAEILNFINRLRKTGLIEPLKDITPQKSDISSACEQSLKDNFALPPTNATINLLPIFNPHSIEDISASDLHPGFKPFVQLSDFALSVRTTKILKRMGLNAIGEMICTPYYLFMEQKNFGPKCLNEIYQVIEQIGPLQYLKAWMTTIYMQPFCDTKALN